MPTPHAHAPPAPTTLQEALDRLEITPRAFARALGVHKNTAYQWRAGRRVPTGTHRARLVAWLQAQGIDPAILPEPPMKRRPPHLRLVGTADTNTNTDSTHAPEKTMPEITSREYLALEELQHFGLTADPFDDPESPEDIWLNPQLQFIENALIQTINRRQITALVGEPGSGKSSLLRRLYGRARRQKRIRLIAAASLDRSRVTGAALSVAILRDLIGRETSSWSMERRSELLRSALADADANGQFPVLILDEAHLLPPRALLAIKQVWDSHTLFRQLGVILIGQQPLEARLRADPSVRELTGRTRILRIPALNGASAAAYLQWRFARIEADADTLFTPGAYQALAARAEYPLWLNNLAVLTLRYARSVGDTTIEAAHVGRA